MSDVLGGASEALRADPEVLQAAKAQLLALQMELTEKDDEISNLQAQLQAPPHPPGGRGEW